MQSREEEKLTHKDEKTKISNIKKKILEIFKRPPLSRSASQLAYLMKVTEHIKFFKDLNEEAQDNDVHRQCCQYFTLETYPKGHPVIVINTVGEKFYIILTGVVSVHIMKQIDDKSETPELKKVATMGAGQSFGELALIADQPRMATILCEEECDFLVLSKRAFDRILKYKKMLNSKLSYLESLPLFAEVNKSFVREIYSRSEYVTFVAKQSVFLEGEDAKAMYIVTKGMFKGMKRFYAEKKQDNELSQKRLEEKPMDDFKIQEKRRDFKLMQIMTYNPNDYFGEQELVEGTKRNYTVLCDSVEGELLVIKKSLFLSKVVGDQRGKQRMAEYIFQKKCLQKVKFSQIQEQVNKFWSYLKEDRQQLKNNLELAEEIRCRKQKAESRTEISSDEEDFFRDQHQQQSQQLIMYQQKDLQMSEVNLRRSQSKNENRSSLRIIGQFNSSPRFHQSEGVPALMKTLSINTMEDCGKNGKMHKQNNPAYFSSSLSPQKDQSQPKSPLLQATRRKYSDNSSLASSQEITSLRKIQDFRGDNINNRMGSSNNNNNMEFKLVPKQVQNDIKVEKNQIQVADQREFQQQPQLGEDMQCILLKQLDGLKGEEDEIVVKKQETQIPATKSISSEKCPSINMNLGSGDYIISSYDQFKDLIKFGHTKIDLKINDEDPQENNQKSSTFDYLKDQRQTNIFKAFKSLKNKINKKHQRLISQESLPKEGVPLIATINPERRPSIPLASRPSTSSSSSGQTANGTLASQYKQQQRLLLSNSQDSLIIGNQKSEKSFNKDKCSMLISGIFHTKSTSSGNVAQIRQQKIPQTQSNTVTLSTLDNQLRDKSLQAEINSSIQQDQEELFSENAGTLQPQNQQQISRNSWRFSESSMTDSPTLNYFHNFHKSQYFLSRNATSPSLLQIPSPSFLQLPSESTTTTTMLEPEQQVQSPLEINKNSPLPSRIHSQHSHRKSLSVKALHLALKNYHPNTISSAKQQTNNINRLNNSNHDSNHTSFEDKTYLQSKNLSKSTSQQYTNTKSKINTSNEVLAAINSINSTTAAPSINHSQAYGTAPTSTRFPAKGNFSYHFNSSSPIKTTHTYISCNNFTPIVLEDSAEAENTPFNNPKQQIDKCSFLFSNNKDSQFETYSQVLQPTTPGEQSELLNFANTQSESTFFNTSFPFQQQVNFKPKNAMRPFSAVSSNSDCKNPFFNSLNANNFLKSSAIKRNRLLSPQQKKNPFKQLPSGMDGIAQSSPNLMSPALFVNVGQNHPFLNKSTLNNQLSSEIVFSSNQQVLQANLEGSHLHNNSQIINSQVDSSFFKSQNLQLIRRPVTGRKLYFGNSNQNLLNNKRNSLQISSATQTPGGIGQDYS